MLLNRQRVASACPRRRIVAAVGFFGIAMGVWQARFAFTIAGWTRSPSTRSTPSSTAASTTRCWSGTDLTPAVYRVLIGYSDVRRPNSLSVWKLQMRAVGLEPTPHGLKGCAPPTEATQSQAVMSGGANACTNACTDSADSGHSAAGEAPDGGPVGHAFAEAVTMLARLPLTDAERAEAIRRLLARVRAPDRCSQRQTWRSR